MLLIDYLWGGIPLFLEKQWQQSSGLRLPGPQAPTQEGRCWEGLSPGLRWDRVSIPETAA